MENELVVLFIFNDFLLSEKIKIYYESIDSEKTKILEDIAEMTSNAHVDTHQQKTLECHFLEIPKKNFIFFDNTKNQFIPLSIERRMYFLRSQTKKQARYVTQYYDVKKNIPHCAICREHKKVRLVVPHQNDICEKNNCICMDCFLIYLLNKIKFLKMLMLRFYLKM